MRVRLGGWLSVTVAQAIFTVGLAMPAWGEALAAPEGLSARGQELLRKAMDGDVRAEFALASAYDTGVDAPRDGTEAMRWYRVAAEAGFAEAQNSVGSGLQAEKRYEEALPWYEKAAAQGNALATNNLAYLYDLGLGVKQDRQKGFQLYSRAAALGWAPAMWNLAIMYGAGQVAEPDLVSSCIWVKRARRYAQASDRPLIVQLNRVEPSLRKSLSSEQYASCEEQAASWVPAATDNVLPVGQSTSESVPGK